MGASLIVRSQIKNYAKVDGKSLCIAEDFYEALNKKAEKLIEEACRRAKANNRKTVSSRDL